MKDFKILVVEDDKSIMNLICTTLRINDYALLSADCGREALSLCASHKPGLILLDLGLPDIDGLEVIGAVREWSQVPIIVISARDSDRDKIEALDRGADDYITKPFSVDELMARIRTVRRRIAYADNAGSNSPVFENGDLRIDYASGIVKKGDDELQLTPIEYRLLCLLAKNAGKVLTHSYIIDNVWGGGIESDIISLRVYMTSLRKKLGTDADGSGMIKTHVGIGYQMIRL